VEACPTKAIHAVNFPAPKPKPVDSAPNTPSTPNTPNDSSNPKVEKEEQA
jgi:hypothetical protein